MNHPALTMLKTWIVCLTIYTVLPFRLIEKSLSLQGLVVLALFLAAFFIGTAVIRPVALREGHREEIDFSRTDSLLASIGMVAVFSLLIDLQNKSVFDLALSYELRSDQAAALMTGEASSSSMWFQIGFLTYPASYVYLVRRIIFDRRLSLMRIGLFGILPPLMSTLSVGGRAPLLYAIVVAIAAMGARAIFMRRQNPGAKPRRLGLVILICAGVIIFGAFSYFVAVFFARAEAVGGAAGMFRIAEEIWGIGFQGPMAGLMFSVLGEAITYVIFIFTWYLVQGLPMSNILFSDYQGPLQLGVYGVDLVSALARRIDGDLVASNFDALQQLGTYGFLPSAFGSLYVDFWLFGLVFCLIWGALAALVYQRIRAAQDSRWLLFAPFVTIGILFSLMNTPIGFSNGLVTHLWMVAAFLCANPSRKVHAQPGAPSASLN